MLYFSIKHNKHLLVSGLYALALSNIFHTRLVSVFVCLFSHTKFDSSVYFHIWMRVRSDLTIFNTINKEAKHIAESYSRAKIVDSFARSNTFITLKDHKRNFNQTQNVG